MNRLLAGLAIAPLVFGRACADEFQIPDNFFRAMPQPNGKMQLFWICPSSLEPESMKADRGWWNSCAKIGLLLDTDKSFSDAYDAAANDPDLAKIDVSYVAWSRATQETKIALRKRVQNAVQPIVRKHRLIELLNAAAVDPALIASRRVQSEKKLAEELGVASPTPTTEGLIHFCPGAESNVSINTQHPLAAKLEKQLQHPALAEQYRSALVSFGKYLDSHPNSTVAERDAELLRLFEPVLQQLR
jgi:hypothetical protein